MYMPRIQSVKDDELLALYLKEIAKYDLLTAEQERRLAGRIKKGNRAALNRLVRANLRFVVSVARSYEGQGVPLRDLINEGNVGLIRAAYKFDASKNFKFISYAVWWIRQAILQAIANQSRLFKIPLNRAGSVYKVGKAEERLLQKYHRSPNTEEVAGETGLSIRHVQTARRIGEPYVSLDRQITPDNPSVGYEVLVDKRSVQPDDALSDQSARVAVAGLLAGLNERDREVLRLYFGIGEETAYTLDEIGLKLKLTRERVRQIKDRALDHLHRECSPKVLQEYFG